MNYPHFDTVLLLDDNPIDLYVAARLIKKNNIAGNLLEFTSPIKALKHLNEQLHEPSTWPQLLLVDIYMPGMSGFEFMKAYDSFPDELKRRSKVYIVSSSIDENDIERANTDPNIVAFQEKPLTSLFLEGLSTT